MLTDQDLEVAVAGAVRAPSVHNTQPWQFHRDGQSVELHADRSRLLQEQDPLGRELLISCGAALRQLYLCLRMAGDDLDCQLLPDPAQPDLLARVSVRGTRAATLPEVDMFSAIWTRHTDRAPFTDQPVDEPTIDQLRSIVEADGCALEVVGADDLAAVAVLTSRAERALENDTALRAEQLRWTTPAATTEGVPASHDGVRASDVALRRFGDLPLPLAQPDPPPVERPTLLVLSTPGDGARDWLTAGWALDDLLLILESQGLAASPLTQVMEMPTLRAQLRGALGLTGQPQVMLRIGYPGAVRTEAPARRPVHDVLR